MLQDIKEVLFSEEAINKRVKELASRISEDYKGKELLVVGVLKGSVIFAAELIKNITIPGFEDEETKDEITAILKKEADIADTAAIDRKIEAQYIYLNGLAASIQQFIRENAMHPQGEDFYDTKLAEYEKQRAEGETRLKDLQSQKAARLSRKELLDGLVNALEESGILIDKFDERLWRLMVEKATVDTDGKLTFTLRNGMEIEV